MWKRFVILTSFILLLVNKPFADIIIESRSGGLNHGYYSEVGSKWLDSSSKSTAQGLTSGIGARFCDLQNDAAAMDTARFAPLIMTPGSYEVFVSWNLGNASTVRHQIFHASGTTNVYLLQDGYGQQGASNANQWISLGTYTFITGVSGKVEVSSTETNGRPGPTGNYRVYADAVKWVWLGGDSAPVSDFTVTTTEGASPLSVTFTDASRNFPTGWSWDFGDNQISTLSNPSHIYSSATEAWYTIRLITTNALGTDTCIKNKFIHLLGPTLFYTGGIDSVSRTGIVVDNLDSGFSCYGNWSLSSGYTQWGINHRVASVLLSSQSNATATWRPFLTAQNQYNIYVWYPARTDRVLDAHYKVVYAGGQQDFYVNQYIPYAGWYYLGAYNCDSGNSTYIQLTNDTRTTEGTFTVAADAVMFEPIQTIVLDDATHWGNEFKVTGNWSVTTTPTYFYNTTSRYISVVTSGAPTATAVWQPNITASGIYQVEVCYPSVINGYSLASDANFTVIHKNGSETISIPQFAHGNINGGHWTTLGTFAFVSGTTGYVILNNLAPQSHGKVVAADAVRFKTFSPLPALEGGEFRAFWAHGIGVMGLRNITEVSAMVDTARLYNFNAMLVHARVAGDAYYDSAFEAKCSALGSNTTFDSLSAIVALAHDTSGGKHYIEVHAWLNPYRDLRTDLSSIDTAKNVMYQHPEWMDQSNSGATTASSMLFTNPAIPENQEYHYKVWLDCIRNYQLDGIHTDDYFYQGSNWGFNSIATSRFAAEYGYAPTAGDSNHGNWRRQEVTNFIRKIYSECLTINPNFKWSIAPVASGAITPYTSSGSYAAGFSDWIDWYRKRYIDIFIPEVYRGYDSTFTTNIVFCSSTAWSWGRHTYFGVGNYNLATQTSLDEVKYSRTTGNTPGSVFFTYHQMNNTATNSIFFQQLSTQIYSAPTTPASMPWKSNPFGGTLKGKIISSQLSPYPYFNGKVVYKSLILYSGSNGTGSTFSDGNGYFSIMDVPYGTYTVKAYTPPVNSGVQAATLTNIKIDRGVVTNVELPLNSVVPVELSAFEIVNEIDQRKYHMKE